MAGEAGRAFVHVAILASVLVIHWAPIVLVAVEARELLGVAGHFMARRTVITPLAAMFARVDGEEKRVVVERGPEPSIDRVTRQAVGRKPGPGVLRVIIVLMTGDTVVLIGRRKERRVSGDHVTAGTQHHVVGAQELEAS